MKISSGGTNFIESHSVVRQLSAMGCEVTVFNQGKLN